MAAVRLMVFLIQNTQNRDAHAMHLKLDELIRANKNARNHLLALEDMSDKGLAGRVPEESNVLLELGHVVPAQFEAIFAADPNLGDLSAWPPDAPQPNP